ncbi:MAG: ATP-grasp domain-containing protein [Planctomycetes bacterium]|nr:ATP-grasp domain-containing protein [Planctomycetota bacterium]
MPRVLLLLPTTTYRTEAFVAAASGLGVDVTVASERPNALSRLNPAALLTLDFRDPQEAAQRVVEFSTAHPIDAVVPVDSQVVVVGASISAALGLRHNSVKSATAAQDKNCMKQQFRQAGVPSPKFTLCSLDEDREALADRVDFPCVVKPLSLAASKGVIRADDRGQFILAVDRLETILQREYDTPTAVETCGDAEAESQVRSSALSRQFLVEQFVGGPEVALEGMLTRGELHTLALFDKPDPLDGPFFEETIYVTPSRLDADTQEEIARCAAQAAQALGLTEGPIHAELRLAKDGPSVIEVNARSIGGLCSRVLRFGAGMSLEELIIRHALEEEFELPRRQLQAAGVMMIPTTRGGRLIEVRGLDDAKMVSGIEDVTISAHLGQRLVPLPEGSRYLGFIFARADSAEAVEAALRESHAQLEFVIEPSVDRTHDDDSTLPSENPEGSDEEDS